MNLLITGAWAEGKKFKDDVEKLGHKSVFMQWENDVLPCEYDWVEGVICNGLFLYHTLSAFSNLRYIQLTSAGFDRIDSDEVKRRGIELRNAKGVYSVPMAEYAVAVVLDYYKCLAKFHDQQLRREWRKIRELRELSHKKVVIVGCGDVGTECAKRFKAFDCEVIGVNRTVRENPLYYDMVVGLDKLNCQLQTADIVIVCIASNENTRGIVKAGYMRQNAVLVNISRGAVVELNGNCTMILDVFDKEPLDFESELWDSSNVFVTPHNSFVSDCNAKRLWNVIKNNLKEFST